MVSTGVCCPPPHTDEPVESLRLRFALLQSLNNTLENFFLPLVELRQTHTYRNSIAALLREAKGERGHSGGAGCLGGGGGGADWSWTLRPSL